MLQVPPVRLGVIGTGSMGSAHVRVAAAYPGCQLLGIYDADPSRAEQIGREYRVPVHRSLAELCAQVEAVIIATPAVTHGEVAAACLAAGCHVLLEKPMAATVREAAELAGCAQQSDRVFMVGHVERYNPAVVALQSLLAGEKIIACDVQRLSTAPGRDQSVDIIFDFMIHDLDLLLAYLPAPVMSVEAHGHAVRGAGLDHVSALLRCTDGATTALTTSWVSHERLRQARLLTRGAQYTVDYANRELRISRFGASLLDAGDGASLRANRIEQVHIPFREPLTAELDHFCQAVRVGTPVCTGADSSLRAVELAAAVQAAVLASQTASAIS